MAEANGSSSAPAPAPAAEEPVGGTHVRRRPRWPQVFKGRLARLLVSLVLVLGVGFAGGWLASESNSSLNSPADTKATQQIVSSEGQLISHIAKTVGPSVVSVNTTSVRGDVLGNSSELEGAGTGIILNSAGVIITNRHVVPAGTSKVSVTLSDGTELEDVSIIGRTSESDSLDVAFLKINNKEGHNLTPAKIGDSAKMQVGNRVVAIGNALGQFQNTVTSGIISGYGRSLLASDEDGNNAETLQNLFQTDAAINQGNSGGPLVNVNGEVIGINTAIARGGSAQDIGFAIPINDVQGLIKSVLQQGKLLRPYLGVHYVSLTDDYAEQLGVAAKRGAYILSGGGQSAIIGGSPAEKAGLREKDIIIKVDNTTIDQTRSLTSVLGQYSVGNTVSLIVLRDGKTITVKATLAAAPEG